MQFKVKYAALCVAATLLANEQALAQAVEGYEIVEIGSPTQAFSGGGYSVNNAGQITGAGYDLLNVPIRLELLDLESPVFAPIENFENLTGSEYRYIRNYLNTPSGPLNQPTFQKLRIADGFVFESDFQSLSETFDVIEPATGTVSYSNSTYPVSINSSGRIVGSIQGPFIQAEGLNLAQEITQYFSPEYFLSAFWTNGVNMTRLHGNEDVIFGGVSQAYAINDSNQVVGFGAVSNRSSIEFAYENCTAEEVDDNQGNVIPNAQIPLGACLYRVWAAAEYNSDLRIPLYNEEAFLWELDDAGNTLSKRALGVAYEIESEDEEASQGYVRSEALDINNNGDIVGMTQFADGQVGLSFATVFTDEGARQLLSEDVVGHTQSVAIGINDSGVIVGNAFRRTSTSFRNRMFLANIENSDATTEVTFPTGFFEDSTWVPRDINNHNFIVGQAEREQTQSSQRRTVGFVYDIENDQIFDLNDLVPCNTGFRIVDAVSINDNGEILVNAFTEREVEYDGRTYSGSSLQVLLLKPVSGSERCGTETIVERKGANTSFSALAFLLILLVSSFITRGKLREKFTIKLF